MSTTSTPTPQTKRRRPVSTAGERMANWDAFSSAVKSQLADLPQAAGDQASFETIVGQLKAAKGEQDALTGKLRESVRIQKDLTAQGRQVRNRLVGHIRSKFGLDSEALHQFGLRPRPSARRKPAATDGTGQAPPAAVPAASPEVKKPSVPRGAGRPPSFCGTRSSDGPVTDPDPRQ